MVTIDSRNQIILAYKEFIKNILESDRRTHILLSGEKGCGKEYFARFIHDFTKCDGNFIAIDCKKIEPAIAPCLWFGYADESGNIHKGLIELADSGTLFLNNIERLPHSLQWKLFEFLDKGFFYREDHINKSTATLRVISASTLSEAEILSTKSLNENLFYKLNLVSFELPPLRERREDIPLLLEQFFSEYSREKYAIPSNISSTAMQIVSSYQWSGNIGEIKRFVRRVVEKMSHISDQNEHLMDSDVEILSSKLVSLVSAQT